MPFKTTTGTTIQPDRAFTLGDVQYPSNWLRLTSDEQKAEVGISFFPDPVFKDERWYYNRVKDGEVTSTPIPLDELKERETRNAKKTSGAMLSGSDWMVIRSVDAKERPVPTDWSEYRAAVRDACDKLEQEIAAADFEGLQSIEQNWPRDPDFKEIDEAI
tara:strand:+ start:113 stop:592 length:480 start_codon:yes stop_codon:yes gene_type:complete